MKKYIITNIRRGSKEHGRDMILYAELRDAETDEVLIYATLDYIVKRLNDLL